MSIVNRLLHGATFISDVIYVHISRSKTARQKTFMFQERTNLFVEIFSFSRKELFDLFQNVSCAKTCLLLFVRVAKDILYSLPNSASGRDRSLPNVKMGNTISLMIWKCRPLYELNWQMKRWRWYGMNRICWQGTMNENMKMKYFSKKSWLLWMLWQGQDLEMWRSLLSIDRFSVIFIGPFDIVNTNELSVRLILSS